MQVKVTNGAASETPELQMSKPLLVRERDGLRVDGLKCLQRYYLSWLEPILLNTIAGRHF